MTRFHTPLPSREREGAHAPGVGRVRVPATGRRSILECTLTRRFAPPSPGTGEGIENEATP
ncbi:hypothetical protein [Azospirillum argentinense]